MSENNDFDKKKDEERALEHIGHGREMSDSESIYAFNWEATEGETEDPEIEKKKKAQGPKFFPHTLIMAITFICAFSVLCFTLVFMSKDNASPPVAQTTSAETEAQEAGKTVYIKEYDDKSGILTPQQIYTDNIGSVVSIKTRTKTTEGIGSGFVFESGGYIATAEHVIKDAESIKIITNDGKELDAEVVGEDEISDLALLKADTPGLTPLEFGSSADLLVGDALVAIGTPASIEFASSMTRGDVSFKDRTVSIYNDTSGILEKKMTLIQTSAALNPGNSGGPVFDSHGKLVGIVTMRLGNDFDGISFIIPSDGAYPILKDMMEGIEITDATRAGVATRAPKLGILGQSNTQKNSDGKIITGVRIEEFSDTESDVAKKLRTGDIIVSIDSESVKNSTELSTKINKYLPGDSISVTVWRNEQLLTFVIILGC